MTIGPVQLLVLGFTEPNFQGEIVAELQRLAAQGTARVIDALIVYKDEDGELEAEHLSNLGSDDVIELDSKLAALIGLGFAGEEGAVAGAELGAEAGMAGENLMAFSDEDAWDVLEEIPNGTAAALVLLEHHWAVPLRDAVLRAGGFPISDGFISPLDLVEIGMMGADEAATLHDLESAGATGRTR